MGLVRVHGVALREVLTAQQCLLFCKVAQSGEVDTVQRLVELANAVDLPIAQLLEARMSAALCAAAQRGHLACVMVLLQLGRQYDYLVA